MIVSNIVTVMFEIGIGFHGNERDFGDFVSKIKLIMKIFYVLFIGIIGLSWFYSAFIVKAMYGIFLFVIVIIGYLFIIVTYF